MSRTTVPDSAVRWDLIEKDYRANKKAIAEIAREHNVSRNRVKRRAEKFGWVRDLGDKISQAAQVKLNQAIAEKAMDALPTPKNAEERDRQIVEVVAQTQVELVRSHRQDIESMRNIARTMVGKLDEALKEGLKIQVSGDDPKADPVIIGMDLEVAGKIFNNLTTGFQRLVQLERQAFGMDEKDKDAGGVSKETKTVMELVLNSVEGLPGVSAQ